MTEFLGNILIWSPYWLVFVAAIFTLISGLTYLYKNKKLLAETEI